MQTTTSSQTRSNSSPSTTDFPIENPGPMLGCEQTLIVVLRDPNVFRGRLLRDQIPDDLAAELTELFEAAGVIVGEFVVVETE